MMNTLARVQVEMAKGASPLTGLPGNVAIEKEIERRISIGLPVSFIYADLDNFKIYNDKYGFDSGDKVLLLVSNLLSWAVRRHGGPDSFIGHVGGDDFVIITAIEQAERLCKGACRCFGRLAPRYYSREDREQGFIEGINRSGDKDRFPLMTISLAIVDCHSGSDIIQVGQLSADMKKYAKTKPGNSYVRNRRESGSQKIDD